VVATMNALSAFIVGFPLPAQPNHDKRKSWLTTISTGTIALREAAFDCLGTRFVFRSVLVISL